MRVWKKGGDRAMWTTFSVMVVISMAIRQIIMDFTLKELRERCQELEKEMVDLKERAILDGMI